MPLLDKITFKNPLLMWLNRRGFLNPSNPLAPVVTRQFIARKQHWQDAKGRVTDRETLADKFLTAEKEHLEVIELKPFDHSLTMIVAGSETTAIQLTSVFYFLLKNPRCYAILQKEVDNIPVGQDSDGSNSIIPFATAQGLPYLNACINESMRLHTVTRMPHDRLVPETGLEVAGHKVPAGTDIGVYGPVMHHRRQVFGEDIDTFRPERWLGDEEKVRRMKSSLFTFSSGKYSCLGQNISRMEITKFVPSVMQTYNISLVKPDKDWTLIPGAFAIPTDFVVRMKKINA